MLDGLLMNMGGPGGHRNADTRGAAGPPADTGRAGGAGRRDEGFISLLEQNKSSVSLETLEAVLEVLGERLSTFFSSDVLQPFVFGKEERTQLADQGCDKFELLIPGSTTMAMEPCRLVLAPGQRLGPHASHNGEEFGYVIRGRLSVNLGRRSTIAKAGESFSYKAQQEHSIRTSAARRPRCCS
jgi:quercetin dioxygenase-like cupin family protein